MPSVCSCFWIQLSRAPFLTHAACCSVALQGLAPDLAQQVVQLSNISGSISGVRDGLGLIHGIINASAAAKAAIDTAAAGAEARVHPSVTLIGGSYSCGGTNATACGVVYPSPEIHTKELVSGNVYDEITGRSVVRDDLVVFGCAGGDGNFLYT